MKKPNYKITTKIVSTCEDPTLLFKTLSIVLGEKNILDLWKRASSEIRIKTEKSLDKRIKICDN